MVVDLVDQDVFGLKWLKVFFARGAAPELRDDPVEEHLLGQTLIA
jgi:hypothetical protein